MNNKLILMPALLCSALLSACGGSSGGGNTQNEPIYTLSYLTDDSDNDDTSQSAVDRELGELITAHQLTGDPGTGRDIPSVESPKAQLGMRLFFSKTLGGEQDTACVSCHHPLLGGGDDLSLPIGVGAHSPALLGPGRTHPEGHPTVPRNSPTTFNMALWDDFIFWDGRIESMTKTPGKNGSDGGIITPDSAGAADPKAGTSLVSAQARFPVTSAEEMRGTFAQGESNAMLRDRLRTRLLDELPRPDYWLDLFKTVYGDGTETSAEARELVTDVTIFDAIAEYERSQVFVDTPWKRYVQGDADAISEEAKQGALLFFKPYAQGGANCVACHASDTFTDERFYAIAAPQLGKGGRGGPGDSGDLGRGHQTGNTTENFAFRTPSLLNVEETGPYTHAGAYLTLEEVIAHHLSPAIAVQNYDYSRVTQLNPGIQTAETAMNTQAALTHLQQEQQANRTPLQTASNLLNGENIAQLSAFLKTLTDPCVKDSTCLADWIPPANEDPNVMQLEPVFSQ